MFAMCIVKIMCKRVNYKGSQIKLFSGQALRRHLVVLSISNNHTIKLPMKNT